MTFNKTLITITILFAALLNACSETEAPKNATNNNMNTNAANSVSTAVNESNPLNTTKTPEIATTNNAPTLTPVVTAYYEALKRKDDGALRKVFSQSTLKTMEADMKADEKPTLFAFITDLEPVPDKPFEVRNEQIQGDVAVAEIRGGAYPNGILRKFVKENGEWKMTNESPEFQSNRK